VRAFQLALTQAKGRAWLYHGWDPVGNSLGMDPLYGDEGEEVQTESLDNLLEENGINRVDVIKVDVEGAEELVLRGAAKTLATNNPIVIFEFNPGCAAALPFHRTAQGISWKAWATNSSCSENVQTLRTPHYDRRTSILSRFPNRRSESSIVLLIRCVENRNF